MRYVTNKKHTGHHRFTRFAAAAAFLAMLYACTGGLSGCTLYATADCEAQGDTCVCGLSGDPHEARCRFDGDVILCTCTINGQNPQICEEPPTKVKCEDRDPNKTSCCLQFWNNPS